MNLNYHRQQQCVAHQQPSALFSERASECQDRRWHRSCICNDALESHQSSLETGERNSSEDFIAVNLVRLEGNSAEVVKQPNDIKYSTHKRRKKKKKHKSAATAGLVVSSNGKLLFSSLSCLHATRAKVKRQRHKCNSSQQIEPAKFNMSCFGWLYHSVLLAIAHVLLLQLHVHTSSFASALASKFQTFIAYYRRLQSLTFYLVSEFVVLLVCSTESCSRRFELSSTSQPRSRRSSAAVVELKPCHHERLYKWAPNRQNRTECHDEYKQIQDDEDSDSIGDRSEDSTRTLFAAEEISTHTVHCQNDTDNTFYRILHRTFRRRRRRRRQDRCIRLIREKSSSLLFMFTLYLSFMSLLVLDYLTKKFRLFYYQFKCFKSYYSVLIHDTIAFVRHESYATMRLDMSSILFEQRQTATSHSGSCLKQRLSHVLAKMGDRLNTLFSFLQIKSCFKEETKRARYRRSSRGLITFSSFFLVMLSIECFIAPASMQSISELASSSNNDFSAQTLPDEDYFQRTNNEAYQNDDVGDDDDDLISVDQPPHNINFNMKLTSDALKSPKHLYLKTKSDNYDCKYKPVLTFDYSLYLELNMHETILSLYRSCFKNEEDEIVRELVSSSPSQLWKELKSSSVSQEERYCKMRAITEKILYHLVNDNHKREIVPKVLLNLFKSICFSESDASQSDQRNENMKEISDFDKLYHLSTHTHSLCSNIYRNSIKQHHLINEILKQDRGKHAANSRLKSDENEANSGLGKRNKDASPGKLTHFRQQRGGVDAAQQSDDFGTDSYYDAFSNGDDEDESSKENDQNAAQEEDFLEIRRHKLGSKHVKRQSQEERQSMTRVSSIDRFYSLVGARKNSKSQSEFSIQNTNASSTLDDYSYDRSRDSTNASFYNKLPGSSLGSSLDVLSNLSKLEALGSSTANGSTITHLNNCTLILLNIYLIAYRTQCNYNEFVQILNHYDCASNNFSVKSDCTQCQNAYKRWLCSSNIPYYESGKILKPCQRYCFDVQNMCPFFRPVDDIYGGQPVFHCRNVIQVYEEGPDGYIDNDENFIDDVETDDERCYYDCSDASQLRIDVDLDKIFENVSSTASEADSLRKKWLAQTSHSDEASGFVNQTYGRFPGVKECLFNVESAASRPFSGFSLLSHTNKHLLYLDYLVLAFLINYSTNFLIGIATARIA